MNAWICWWCVITSIDIPEDVALQESRIRRRLQLKIFCTTWEALAAVSSDSLQAMGRVEKWLSRSRQRTKWQGPLAEDTAQNFQAKRYIAKYELTQPITHGIATDVGSVGSETSRFMHSGGRRFLAWNRNYDKSVYCPGQENANASIPTHVQFIRPMFGSFDEGDRLPHNIYLWSSPKIKRFRNSLNLHKSAVSLSQELGSWVRGYDTKWCSSQGGSRSETYEVKSRWNLLTWTNSRPTFASCSLLFRWHQILRRNLV